MITVAWGQSFERLEHRHGGAHAVGARHVAGGRDDPALAAADDHRLVGEARVVPLLHRREERIAIHMGDGEAVALPVPEQARGAAGRAPFRQGLAAGVRQSRQKGASLMGGRSYSNSDGERVQWACMMCSGLVFKSFARAIRSGSSETT